MSLARPAAESMVIRALTPTLTTLSVPFLRFNKIKVGGRATIITLQNGDLAVFSPVALTPDVESTIAKLGSGQIRYIIAPDIEHHMSIGPWKERWKEAEVVGPEGLYEKRKSQGNEDVKIDWVFKKGDKEEQLPVGMRGEFEAEYFDMHPNKEIVLLHKPSETLIQADLFFNLPATEQFSKVPGGAENSGILDTIANHATDMNGSWGKRFVWHAFARDKARFNEGVKRIAGWKFSRVIPCHGDVIEEDGNTVFRRLFRWHLEEGN